MRQVMPTAENTFSSQPYHIHNNHTQDNHRHTPTADLEQRLPSSPLVTPPLNPTAMSASRNTAATETSTHRGSPTVRNERSPSDNNILTRRGVPHVYHDYARIPDEPALIDHTPQRKKSGGVAKPFPEKLHDMLDAETPLDVNQAEVVCWLPHGRAFIVRHPKIFTQVIMPKYFNQTKLTSFQRQLNLYGFRRITQGLDAGAYYHELFLRGRRGLSNRMVRQKVKGTKTKQPADVASEPNFYTMLPLPCHTPLGNAVTSTVTAPPLGTPMLPPTMEPQSPGLRNVHHAASALTSLATGAFTFLPRVPFGVGTREPPEVQGTLQEEQEPSNATQRGFLQPRNENV